MLAQRDVILTAAEVELGHAAALGGVEDTPRASPVAGELSCMGHYLQEVRRFALLSPAREVALAQHIQDGSWQWRDALVQHLLHVPLLLAYRARLRRGVMPIAALCVPGAGSPSGGPGGSSGPCATAALPDASTRPAARWPAGAGRRGGDSRGVAGGDAGPPGSMDVAASVPLPGLDPV